MKKILTIFSLAIMLASCGGNNDNNIQPITTEETDALLVYMVGDNSLSSNCTENIDSIVSGMQKSVISNNAVYVYVDNKSAEQPQLIKFTKKSNIATQETIKTYAEGNSASKERLSTVINDMKSDTKATKLGLVLWSHANGWLPPHFYDYVRLDEIGGFSMPVKGIQLQSFGQDGNDEMSIEDMAEAISPFDYIIFDACQMSAIEVAYELRNKTNYIIAAATETTVHGIPYAEIVPMIMKGNVSYTDIYNATYNFYKKWNPAAISLIKTSEIDALASVVSSIYKAHPAELASIDKENIQRFDRFYDTAIIYDLGSIIKAIATANELAQFNAQIAKCVLMSKTENASFTIPIKEYSGLSSYIIGVDNYLDNAYKSTKWYKAVY